MGLQAGCSTGLQAGCMGLQAGCRAAGRVHGVAGGEALGWAAHHDGVVGGGGVEGDDAPREGFHAGALPVEEPHHRRDEQHLDATEGEAQLRLGGQKH
jgi:hypothetical protein